MFVKKKHEGTSTKKGHSWTFYSRIKTYSKYIYLLAKSTKAGEWISFAGIKILKKVNKAKSKLLQDRILENNVNIEYLFDRCFPFVTI